MLSARLALSSHSACSLSGSSRRRCASHRARHQRPDEQGWQTSRCRPRDQIVAQRTTTVAFTLNAPRAM